MTIFERVPDQPWREVSLRMARHASFLSLSFIPFLPSFIIRCDRSALLRRRLEVLVRGVLVAVHLHARHVFLLRTRCLVHLDEALEKQADYKSDQVGRQINLQRKLPRAREIQVVRT